MYRTLFHLICIMKITTAACLLLMANFFSDTTTYDSYQINQIQVIGSHNSYKRSIDPAEFRFLTRLDSARFSAIDYDHIPLSDQLDLGLRDLEIDVAVDTAGGKYAHPLGLKLVKNQAPYTDSVYMNSPGFKVIHVPDLDFRTNCPTFKICLQQLKKWSDMHSGHNVIFITMNAKDDAINRPGFTIPDKFNTGIFDKLDKEITDNLGSDKVITPDQIRGRYATLEQAALHHNWPTVKASKNKFIFVLDEKSQKRASYIAGHPSLRGRIFFTDSDPGTPEAAILIMNNAKKDKALIQERVKAGYIVRTRADADTREARTDDYSSFNAAKESGAQIISTDYYKPSTHFKSTYRVNFSPGIFIRANPVAIK